MARRFRWTRSKYRKAHHLSRLLGRLDYYADKPALVERLHELWEKHPQREDPLLQPLRYRLRVDDDIPF